MMNIIS